jgi:hypothetical protein
MTESDEPDEDTGLDEDKRKKKERKHRKKTRIAEDVDEDEEKQARKLRRAEKKRKRAADELVDDHEEIRVRREKKGEKKRKREADDNEAPQAESSPVRADKKQKKHKKRKTEKCDADIPAAEQLKADAFEQWHVGDLKGGEQRQKKFLRLLGAGRDETETLPGARPVSQSHLSMDKVEHDLQKQYDAGLKIKRDGQGQRKGLGA